MTTGSSSSSSLLDERARHKQKRKQRDRLPRCSCGAEFKDEFDGTTVTTTYGERRLCDNCHRKFGTSSYPYSYSYF